MSLIDAPLGKSSEYPDSYDPTLLFPIPRDVNRRRIGLEDGRWPWFGEDLWQGWEISWIRPDGVPAVAWAEIFVPAASPSIV
jgi:7-cyano-7-deazaguanine reductase